MKLKAVGGWGVGGWMGIVYVSETKDEIPTS